MPLGIDIERELARALEARDRVPPSRVMDRAEAKVESVPAPLPHDFRAMTAQAVEQARRQRANREHGSGNRPSSSS
jgi:hypothetical protein